MKHHRLGCMLSMVFCYFVVEISVGYVTGSLALVADAFHMLGDALALSVALYANHMASSPTIFIKNTYGWQRAELVGALVNGVFLAALCFTMIISAVQRFFVPAEMYEPKLVLIVGGVGLVINIVGLGLFGGHHGGHSHSHSGEIGLRGLEEIEGGLVEKLSSSSNMHAVFLHVLGDALGSIAVMLSALVIWLAPWPNRHYIDPITSLFIAALLLHSVVPLIKRCSLTLMLGVPTHINALGILEEVLCLQGVDSVHDFHVWQLSDDKVVASLHMITSGHTDFMNIARDIQKVFHKHGVHSITIQPEFMIYEFEEVDEIKSRCLIPCNGSAASICSNKHCCHNKTD
jgi:zinc transporter 1